MNSNKRIRELEDQVSILQAQLEWVKEERDLWRKACLDPVERTYVSCAECGAGNVESSGYYCRMCGSQLK